MLGRWFATIPIALLLLVGSSAAQPLTYSVATEDSFDTPAKAQAVLHVVVAGKVTRASVDELLNRLYRDAASRPSKYHGRVTHVAVFAYETEAHAKAGMAQWLGMISRIGATAPIKLEIREDRIGALTAPRETRFGLSEEQRQAAWREKVQASDRAQRDAMARYPDPPPRASREEFMNTMRQQAEHQRSLVKAAEAAIAKRYQISTDQLRKISVEAHEKNWALPR